MLKLFDFSLSQLRYLKQAMDKIPSFRPDGRSPAEVQALIDAAVPVRALFLGAGTALEGARALRRAGVKALHVACMDFGQQAPSAYRKDATVMLCLAALPTHDRSISETLGRAEAILAQWAQLPLIGVPAAVFQVAQVEVPLTLAGLEALRAAAAGADAAVRVVEQELQLQRAVLKTMLREVRDVVTAALAVGRPQFPKGTAQRESIEAIPTVSPRQKPGKAVVSSAAVAAPGTVRLDYEAAGATSFEVFMKRPGAAAAVRVAEEVAAGSYEIPGLEPGRYGFSVRGRNGRGAGQMSAVVTLMLGGEGGG